MFKVLTNRIYRHLFFAQVVSLIGTGLATVALGFLAYNLAGADAGAVLGIALAIKMAAYIVIAPIAVAFSDFVPRRNLLIFLDIIRALFALLLPFVTQIWQIYLLIFLLQSASAAFTPIFQATIPTVLPKEKDYTRALSLSRLAYDLENIASPLLAVILLSIINFHNLFYGTVIGFLISATLVITITLPKIRKPIYNSMYARTTRGMRIYLTTPRLQGLLALNLAIAFASAMVIVNTIVIVQAHFGLAQKNTAFALGAFGGGSMLAALILPSLLQNSSEKKVMLSGGIMLVTGLLIGIISVNYIGLILIWSFLGVGYSLAQTPMGRLIRRSANNEDQPALFAAQFSLSHLCWLIAYPLAGWLGATLSLSRTFGILAALSAASLLICLKIWSRAKPDRITH